MASKLIYLSPSNQEHNVGVGGYNEEKQMHILAEKVKFYLLLSPMFQVLISKPEMTFEQVEKDSDNWGADLHLCLHSDAGPPDAKGTTAFIYKKGGEAEKFARMLYPKIALLSPGADRGINVRPGLYELKKTHAPAVLIENFFHTSKEEVTYFYAHIDDFAREIARSVYEFYNVPFIEITLAWAVGILSKAQVVTGDMIIDSSDYWLNNDTYDTRYVRSLIVDMAKYIKNMV